MDKCIHWRPESSPLLPDDLIRERGLDPDTHWEESVKQMKRIRDAGAVLDIDASLRAQAGNAVTAGLPEKSDIDVKDSASPSNEG